MAKTKSVLLSSGVLFALSKKAAERSKTDPQEAVVAIIMTVASVECLFNDLFHLAVISEDNDDPQIRAFSDVMATFDERRLTLIEKLKISSALLRGKSLNLGVAPFQDFTKLRDLRNGLVHRFPDPLIPLTFEEPAYRNKGIIDFLINKGLSEVPPGSIAYPTLSHVASNAKVAAWAYKTGGLTRLEICHHFESVLGPKIEFFNKFEEI